MSERADGGHVSGDPDDDVTRRAVRRARQAITEHERTVPDFPKPGILFRDLTPVLADTEGFASIVTALTHGCSGVDLVAGIDARGFLVGGAVAQELGVGILAVRKGGKLPPPVHGVDYDLEYGTERLEIPASGIDISGRRVLVVDDVLATGGTAVAASTLMSLAGASVVGVAVIMELADLGGRERIVTELGPEVHLHAITDDR
ncbi:adenine phosphoribosyltransferase [Gordonia aichiensis]|uniref:Adenine phosphoribosyltransferase n=1 Tax=Gordonia aichiensis NBRC 108223 TaxID=1220583 RepID=L7KI33_9ACTN|nr:adenine phosphoribosyltransferase [Gordonia aichiensis NBRC 108223]